MISANPPADASTTASPKLSSGPLRVLREPAFRHLFFAALAGNVFSKAGALLPGMASDDYFFAFPVGDGDMGTFIAQGRVLNMFMVRGAASLGLSLTSIQIPCLLLAMITISLFIAAAVHAVAGKTTPQALPMCAAAIAATHPYLSTYFLFRMAILGHALTYAVLFLATWVLSAEALSVRRKLVICTVLLAFWSNSTQIVLFIFTVTGIAWALAQGCQRLERGEGYKNALRPLTLVIAILLSSGLLYMLSSDVIRRAAGIAPSVEYTPHLAHGLAGFLAAEGRLAWGLVAGSETVLPMGLKVTFFILLGLLLAGATVRQPRWGLAGIAVMVAGMLVTVSPMALSWDVPVPRTFSTLGIVVAMSVALASRTLGSRTAAWATLPFLPVVLLFGLIGGTLFFQQSLLANWDQRTAAGVYREASAKGLLVAGRRLRLVTSWPFHGQTLSMGGSGVNESALLNQWSWPALFAVATGERVDATAGDPALCKDRPPWPAPGAIRLVGNRDVYVCLK